jgi:hypothetical protein
VVICKTRIHVINQWVTLDLPVQRLANFTLLLETMWRACISLLLVGTAVAELLSTLPFELTSALKQDFFARLDNGNQYV